MNLPQMPSEEGIAKVLCCGGGGCACGDYDDKRCAWRDGLPYARAVLALFPRPAAPSGETISDTEILEVILANFDPKYPTWLSYVDSLGVENLCIGTRHFVEAIRALSPAPTAGGEAIADEHLEKLVAQAMDDAWNEICSDTEHHPEDIKHRREELYFEPAHWARATARYLKPALASPPSPAPAPVGDVPCRFGCEGAVGIYLVPKGCVCWDDPVQALCQQHAVKAESEGPIRLIARPFGVREISPAPEGWRLVREALAEIEAENERALRQFTNVSNNLIHAALKKARLALPPASEQKDLGE